jgi:hypothetical protein
MTDAEFGKRRAANIGQPLDKWPKADLVHEVRRLRELNSGYIETVMELQGITGSVSTEEINAALSQHSKKNTK